MADRVVNVLLTLCGLRRSTHSPKQEELFGPAGITARTFRDAEGSKHVGLIAEIPDMAVWQEILQSEAGAEAMKYDGVHPDTIRVLTEG